MPTNNRSWSTGTSSPLPKVAQILGSVPQRDRVLREGWIWKKSEQITFNHYDHRFVQLRGDKLICFKGAAKGKLKETKTFDLSQHRFRVAPHRSVGVKFYLIRSAHKRTFKAPTENERNEWVDAIRQSIRSGHRLRTASKERMGAYYGSASNSLSLFATLESRMANKGDDEMLDSESESEDAKLSVPRAQSMSRRKSTQPITERFFENYRIASLTVHATKHFELDESEVSDQILLEEEKESFSESEQNDDAKDDDPNEAMFGSLSPRHQSASRVFGAAIESMDSALETNSNNASSVVVEQLAQFGYDRETIATAMHSVANPKNINDVREQLELNEQQTIDAKEAKRQRLRACVEAEIVSTEETYCECLETLLHELIEPMFRDKLIDAKFKNQIRSSIPKIIAFHRPFLEQLRAAHSTQCKSIAAVFNECVFAQRTEFVEIYLRFIADYSAILELFGTTFHGNAALDQFLYIQRMQNKPLSALLILPVQRVPRYILLLTDLRKHSDANSEGFAAIHGAVEMVRAITREINERKRKIENLAQCLQLQQTLKGLRQPIVSEERVFVRQFIFIKRNVRHRYQRIFLLFSDLLILWATTDAS